GRQRVSGPELLMVAALLVIAGGVLSFLDGRGDPDQPVDQPASGEVESIADVLNRLPSIAVLTFVNRSDLSSDQYFTDGICDELLTSLQRVPGLKVISRTSSEAYRETELSIPEIGRELGVAWVLEGSVQRAGDQVRIIAQLIDAVNEGHIWSETFDLEQSGQSLLDVQSRIVGMVAGELNIELREEERLRAARRFTANSDAYDLYLRALDRGYEEAISLLEQAVERDPGFVAAHAELAKAHARRYQMAGDRSEERAATAREAAERAVQLAPESEDAQLAMGHYEYRVEKDWEAALDWLGRASGTLIGDGEYHRFRAYAERRMGRWRQSVASLEAAVSLSPKDASAWSELGLSYLCMRRYDEAEEALLEADRLGRGATYRLALLTWFRDGSMDGWPPFLERNPTSIWAWEIVMTEGRHEDAAAILPHLPDTMVYQYHWYPRALVEAETLEALGQVDDAREKYQEAASILEPLVEQIPDDERYPASLAWAYAALGMEEEAVRLGRSAVAIMPRERDALHGPFFLFDLAAVHARLGEVDEALEVLEDLLSAPARFAPNMLEDHFRLRPIQDDPRFQALMDRERGKAF
ncbi:MAG: hypothetical protein KAJ42_18645, partial [Gemmatimonadetes bacterium]|nr:hypothetical protein [Gemmatimonadota bacterium]